MSKFSESAGPAFASFVIPGTGQLIIGKTRRGKILLGIYLVLLVLFCLVPAVYITISSRNGTNLSGEFLSSNLNQSSMLLPVTALLCLAGFLPILMVVASLDAYTTTYKHVSEREKLVQLLAKKIIAGELLADEASLRAYIEQGDPEMTNQFSTDYLKSLASSSSDMTSVIQRAVETANKALGKINILILGKAGVGKSTLINAIFQGELATTGQGRPVTSIIREYTKEGIPISIYDTPGLELTNYDEAIKDLRKLISEHRAIPDLSNHIHLAWYCISQDSRRVETSETELTDMLVEQGLPVIVVITKSAAKDQGFSNTVQELIPGAVNVVRVRAIGTEMEDGYVIPPMGLDRLVDVTMEVTPDAARNALAAAVKDISAKERRAHKAVAAAAATAATIGAVPIPFADATLLIPLQITMLATISTIYGMRMDKAFMSTLISSAITTGAATAVGRSAVSGLIKLIPGAGSVIGGVINGSVAAVLTTSFGEAYIRALSYLMKTNPDRMPTVDQIEELFKAQLKKEKPLPALE